MNTSQPYVEDAVKWPTTCRKDGLAGGMETRIGGAYHAIRDVGESTKGSE